MSKEAINKARELFSSLPWQMKYIPIRVEEVLSTQMNITLCYTDIDTEDGYTVKYKGKYRIFINPKTHPMRLRFTLAHELSHILLGHIDEQQMKPDPWQEYEADAFASELLMPEEVVCKYQKYPMDFITKFFYVSESAMKVRLKTIQSGKVC